ncbi:MAG: hypothetical protein HYS41_00055 [Candidatus Omnitrophica bacterium]|nr:hypothetical protein [Candidatus Omnitrophota bacterium]
MKTIGSSLLVLSLLASGCAPFLLAAGAVGGYAVSKDSVTVDLDRPLEQVWKAAVEETKRLGKLKKEDRNEGRIEVLISRADVVVTVESLTPATVRVVVRARKHLLPQIQVAQRVATAIIRRVG